MLSLIALLFVGACGEEGSYELSWVFDCPQGGAADCGPTNARQCSGVGLDSIKVQVLRDGAQEASSIFPCYSSADGARGFGPGLGPGQVTLRVSGFAPGGQQLVADKDAAAEIPELGFVKVQVKLTPPKACADGVDNDGDGQVDLLDPGCKDAADADEAK